MRLGTLITSEGRRDVIGFLAAPTPTAASLARLRSRTKYTDRLGL